LADFGLYHHYCGWHLFHQRILADRRQISSSFAFDSPAASRAAQFCCTRDAFEEREDTRHRLFVCGLSPGVRAPRKRHPTTPK
jgi:hypothetical protein